MDLLHARPLPGSAGQAGRQQRPSLQAGSAPAHGQAAVHAQLMRPQGPAAPMLSPRWPAAPPSRGCSSEPHPRQAARRTQPPCPPPPLAQVMLIVETCQASTLYSRIASPNVLSIASSLKGESSYSHTTDSDVGLSLMDRCDVAPAHERRGKGRRQGRVGGAGGGGAACASCCQARLPPAARHACPLLLRPSDAAVCPANRMPCDLRQGRLARPRPRPPPRPSSTAPVLLPQVFLLHAGVL
jgi:hypothetical protein